jgi:Glycosyl hydrolase family 12
VIALGKCEKGDGAEIRGNGVDARKGLGRPHCPRIPILLGLVVALALPAGLAPAARASSSARPPALSSTRARPVPGRAAGPVPDAGVVGNAPYCNRDYERLAGSRYIAYNDDLGDYTCLQTTDQQDANGFRMTTFKQDVTKRVGAFPNIFAGFEWGRHPENSFLPAEESKDGDPLVAVSVNTVPGGDYNAAYDIWFNKTDPPDPWDLGENNGAELMIWLVNHQPPQGAGNYEIDGHSWTMMKWTAGNSQTKTTWHYIAFITTSNITTATLRLNPFFKEAIRLGSLSPSWYLTNIAFGFELRGGDLAGLAVKSFSVQDVRSGIIPPLMKNPNQRKPMPGPPPKQPKRP